MARGLSGVAVAFMGLGGVLVYAGFRGVSPAEALRAVAGGKPEPVEGHPVELVGASVGGIIAGAAASGSVVAAAQPYMNDRYSQARRREPGWSDCSSFVDKVLEGVGIPPPVKWAASANYRLTTEWRTIPAAQAKPGDIAVSGGHIVLVTAPGGASAIGQQNPRVNVRTGSVANLMGRQSYVYRTYVGKR